MALRESQKKAVSHVKGPLLCLAGPGIWHWQEGRHRTEAPDRLLAAAHKMAKTGTFVAGNRPWADTGSPQKAVCIFLDKNDTENAKAADIWRLCTEILSGSRRYRQWHIQRSGSYREIR